MRSLSKLLCAVLSEVILLSTIIMTAGCDDKVWNRVDTPTGPLLLLAVKSMQNTALPKTKAYTVNVTVSFTTTAVSTGTGVVLQTIGGDLSGMTLSGSYHFILHLDISAIFSTPILVSPNLWSCSLTPDPTIGTSSADIFVSCTPN
jgi:hypothetical protein